MKFQRLIQYKKCTKMPAEYAFEPFIIIFYWPMMVLKMEL